MFFLSFRWKLSFPVKWAAVILSEAKVLLTSTRVTFQPIWVMILVKDTAEAKYWQLKHRQKVFVTVTAKDTTFITGRRFFIWSFSVKISWKKIIFGNKVKIWEINAGSVKKKNWEKTLSRTILTLLSQSYNKKNHRCRYWQLPLCFYFILIVICKKYSQDFNFNINFLHDIL